MSRGFDTTGDCTPHGQEILDAGYTFVARYYCEGSRIPTKCLTPAEAAHLSGMGIYLVSVWETIGDHPEYFTHDQGQHDAQVALQIAENVGQPKGTPIYFAVDYDASVTDGRVQSYFQGVRDCFQEAGPIDENNYFVGVYGSGATCQHLTQIGFVSYTWLAVATGWGGYDAWKDQANLVQGSEITLFGMDCDENTSNGDAGGWKIA
ncbi:MAG TPA: DUF1906 domain-containing protein [Chthonomonadaceae bacterium]|nr:DUF1906 domain-containing protein [Chthonomonadaceae bacterium]